MQAKRSKKIRKDTKVYVVAGNQKGTSGTVLKVTEDKVWVQGVNMRKKHVKPTRSSQGGIVEREMPIHISNVKLFVEDKASAGA